MALTKVSTDGVKNDAITKVKIPANQIEASELADNAVDTNAIANNAVTAGKLASGVQTTINNNADNRVITGSGTANTLNAESGVVIDSSGRLLVGTTTDNGFKFKVSDSGGFEFAFAPNDSGVNNLVNYNRSGNAYVPFQVSGSDLRFGSGGNTERMRIDSSGRLLLGNTSSFDSLAQLHIERANNTVYSATTNTSNGINIYNNSATNGGFCGIQLGSSSSSGHYGSTLLQNVSVADGYSSDFVIKTRFSGSYAERLRVTSNGLTFNGDTAAANALNDYEEGTFTPTISVEGESNSSLALAIGRYVKIGRSVHIHFEIQLNGTPSSRSTSDAWQFDGFPFSSILYNASPAGGVRDYEFPLIAKNVNTGSTYGSNGHFLLRLFDNSTGGRIEWQHSDLTIKNASLFMQDGTIVRFSCTYLTA